MDQLVLPKELSTAEVNLVKSVVSQLQVDVNGTNEIRRHKPNQVPELDAHKSVYRTMEVRNPSSDGAESTAPTPSLTALALHRTPSPASAR